jgi:5-methylcytosine-specific restriction endonuclease McrA
MQRKVYPDGTKTCRTCAATKPLTDFYQYKRKSGPSPLSECKSCSKARTSEHWRRNRDRRNAERNAKRRATPGTRAGERRDPLYAMNDTARRRAKKYGVLFEPVSPRAILERDGWICYLCAQDVTQDTLSFDHVVPMGRGGSHTANNIRVAHRTCNRAKSAGFVTEVACPNCAHRFVP